MLITEVVKQKQNLAKLVKVGANKRLNHILNQFRMILVQSLITIVEIQIIQREFGVTLQIQIQDGNYVTLYGQNHHHLITAKVGVTQLARDIVNTERKANGR